MRLHNWLGALALSLSLNVAVHGYNLHINGVVTEYLTGAAVTNGTVRLYKDGVKVEALSTGSFGKYAFTLENNSKYILRFGAPGHQTKCFSIDTHGLEWEGESRMKDLWVEMTLFERVEGIDLSFFDLPMGMASFEPATGLVSWDLDYDKRIREQVQSIMSDYERKMTATASVEGDAIVRRGHSGAAR
jgi:hypothetical protein